MMCNLFEAMLEKLKPPESKPEPKPYKRKQDQCFYCGYSSDKVEAGGVYPCPQKFCQGPGNFYARWKNGYQEEGGYQSDEQESRMIRDCYKAMNSEKDWNLRAAIERSYAQLKAGIDSQKGDECGTD